MDRDGEWDPVCRPRRGLVRPLRIDPTDRAGPTRGQAAGRAWRRTSHGLYVPASVDGSLPEQRVVEQAARLTASGAVTGWGACRLHGANFFDGFAPDARAVRPVVLAVGRTGKIRADDQAVVSREPLDASEIVIRQGVRVTEPARALFDEMRRLDDWREAVVAMDMMAAAGLVSIAVMQALAGARSAWRNAKQVLKALRFATERSRSPSETRLRLLWELDAGLPRPLVNPEIFTRDGRLVAVVDLLDPVAGLVGEYDGAAHRRTRRRSRDIMREESLRRLGLEYVDVVAPGLADPLATAARIRSTRARAAFLPEGQRPWTVEPPVGWPVEQSLDERLFLREMSRRMADPDG